ncbi:MAG TPA: hypothetical protein VM099_09945 [Gemmatimonadaceae bacterium]|nr:hypothetical protein [Gemmatimonadaceae bacterium]
MKGDATSSGDPARRLRYTAGRRYPSSPMVTDAELRAVLTTGLDAPVSPRARELIDFITNAFGPSIAAIIHYGSRAQKTGSKPDSAYDFFVIVDDYETAFLSFAEKAHPGFSARSAILLSRFLPPSIVALTHFPGEQNTAKCAVLSLKDLFVECSSDSPDHFVKGRLFQQLQLAWFRDDKSKEAAENAIVAARLATFQWGAPYLPKKFSAEDYCWTLLKTSFAGEIRPETAVRIRELLNAQAPTMFPVYEALLQKKLEDDLLRQEDGSYSLVNPPSPTEKARVDAYFRRSKARATTRWVKLIWLYDGWLDYLSRKIGRRANHSIDLTPQERRWPFLFLWPKLIRYINSRR